ncbi:MAG: hypothetical protein GTN38_01450 [Candidatus Aenigmarchaeota archaeon]|nr:hypothetical protein [Candidatus Aenigmarchaeota archaeon]NIQ17527.1 hypothetical protein [Candidatus Aenigmarchaeota archaeon]NIS73105.1 hypothetical protein [Candidatus Aenigmarchaeota archaeon]
MKLSICGMTASGKSYQAKKIAGKFNLEYISGSDFLLEMAGFLPEGDHFWISELGEQLTEERIRNPEIDRKADELILQKAITKEDVIFDSWTLPWLYKGGDLYKICLAANLEARAKIAYGSRERKPYNLSEIRERIRKKDEDSAKIFWERYGIDISDHSPFDLIIDNSELKPGETYRILVNDIMLKFQPVLINSG